MRILLVVTSLSAGGAERVLTELANHLCNEHRVSVLTFDHGDQSPFYELEEGVGHRALGIATSGLDRNERIKGLLKAPYKLSSAIGELSPDLIISFIDHANVMTLFANFFDKTPIIVSERAHPSVSSLLGPHRGELERKAIRIFKHLLYMKAERIIVVSPDLTYTFPSFLHSKILTIPNPVRLEKEGEADCSLPPLSIVAMGRLVRQKRFDLLINAFAKVADELPGWSVHIFGEGPLEDKLKSQINSCGLSERIVLHGLTQTPLGVFAQAELFILSSDAEGFPNVLLEALSTGTPAIATNCPTGPSDIIEHGKNGLLVITGDVDELASAIKELLGNEERRKMMGEEARKVTERFNYSAVMDKWDSLLGGQL